MKACWKEDAQAVASEPQNETVIEAIYGNVVYSRLKKGLIYVFKVSPTGQVYPEIVPDM